MNHFYGCPVSPELAAVAMTVCQALCGCFMCTLTPSHAANKETEAQEPSTVVTVTNDHKQSRAPGTHV